MAHSCPQQKKPSNEAAGVEVGCVMAFTVDRSRTIISAMIHGRKVSAMDVAWLRREVFAEGWVSVRRRTGFAVERAGLANAPRMDGILRREDRRIRRLAEASGIVNDDQADWLIARADECASVNALAALVAVLAEAQRAPAWFVAAVRARAARGLAGGRGGADGGGRR